MAATRLDASDKVRTGRSWRHRALAAGVLALATAVPLGLVGPDGAPGTQSALADHTPVPETVTIAGSLQSELGCPGDWDPACAATELPQVGDTPVFTGTLEVPAGSYEFKSALNGSWDESYGLGGTDANIPLMLAGPASIEVSYDHTTHFTTMRPTGLPDDEVTPEDEALWAPSLREALTDERFYFVMADRFANGDPTNDEGGLVGGPLETGFDPTNKGFYHGGDLAGILDHLDYIKGLGTTAIWLTPSFKNRPVQGTGVDASAGYHGYWITDFTQIDPHLGTNAEMTELIDAAHARGMKVFFDIITNHTADVIDYEEGQYSYVDKSTEPYRDATGTPFDDRDYAGGDTFPELDPAVSFPYTPVFRMPEDETIKVPDWLDEPIYYHNRGDSTFAGESSTYGDFVGLDDLFTEHPDVVGGMVDIYQAWADFGIDGFRIDTVKHVNTEFWQAFGPSVLQHARDGGNEDFFMFGEVFDGSPAFMSQYTTTGRLQATLDFGFQGNGVGFAQGRPTRQLRDLYAGDDYYTDTDSNAYQLPTFLGNHDIGRVGMMLTADADGDELLQRDVLAHQIMYLTRGQPVVYYGDEQGFTGDGGDKDARQDMFASQVASYNDDEIIGGEPGSMDRYGTDVPLYEAISEVAKIRKRHAALTDGAQVHRYSSSDAGIFAFTRIDADELVEYVVVANNALEAKSATLQTYSERLRYRPVLGADAAIRSDREGRVGVTVPPLTVQVFRARRAVDEHDSAPVLAVRDVGVDHVVEGRAEIGAVVPAQAETFSQVTFAYRPSGTEEWQRLGTDDNAPYRVFHDVTGFAPGTMLEYRLVLRDASGNFAATSSYGVVGDAAGAAVVAGARADVSAVEQPDAVSVPGSHNTEMGCPGDWEPGCDQAQLALDPNDDIWKGTHAIPAGSYEYKAAINRSWDENYGLGGVPGGPNIPYVTDGSGVSFYYDHRTHWAHSDAEGPIITVPGSHQSEMGCSGDWDPACMRTWLQDPDADGVYELATAEIPAGSYEAKVTHGLSWDENYGLGGVPNGPNIPFTVPEGATVTFSYVLETHILTITTGSGEPEPDLGQSRAFWVDRDLLAWPSAAVPPGTPPEWLSWRLHWSETAGLEVDEEAVVGGSSARLTYDLAGLPEEVVGKNPELEGYLALRLDPAVAERAKSILRGQVVVAEYDDLGRLVDATGTQIPIVLDSLNQKATERRLGLVWVDGSPRFKIWAPTAQAIALLVWPPGAGEDPPQRYTPVNRGSGVWRAAGVPVPAGSEYQWEIRVFAPSTLTIETNQVTDPYSVALTTNSTRSVAVDLSDPALAPEVWATTPSPELDQPVDSTIYELHVRDFSINDQTVPEAHRGSYLAFADDGAGRAHLEALAGAGLNTVHLLPTFDIATIEEVRADQAVPACDLPSYPPDSPEQQACVMAVAGEDGFNWGYDPYHYLAPEGSYATEPDGAARVVEYRTMVGALHESGLRVVRDEVYNHTAASGQGDKSVLDKVVPGYYHRLNPIGDVYTSTCCQNVATEHAMAGKLMVDGTVLWAREYKIDGFRYDLMGHHSKANMIAVRAALDELTLEEDGVDGESIFMYGEGWNFGEVADNALFEQATQGQLGGTGIGTFSDRLRDAVRGGGPFDEDPRTYQGFGSGLFTDPNGAPGSGTPEEQAARLAHATDLLELGLAGNLRDFVFRSESTGELVTGEEVDYNGQPAGYADEPDEVITYVDAHDNETLFDSLTFKLPVPTTMADRVRMNTLSLGTVALAQTPTFWHAGTDLLRSKSLDRNSYDSGDWFNTLDWTGQDNGFGHGLPPAPDNEAKWPIMAPLLANGALDPSASDVATAGAVAQDLLRLRFSTPLFRLGSAETINQKLTFPLSGTEDSVAGVIVMRLDDLVGADLDPALAGVLVVFNATPSAVLQTVPELVGASLELSPVQADGVDPVVKTTTWDSESGTVTVPARTIAVLIQPEP